MLKKIILSAGRKIKAFIRVGSPRYDKLPKNPKDIQAKESPAVVADGTVVEQERAARKPAPKRNPRPKKPAWTLDNFKVLEVAGKKRFHDYEIPLQIMRAIADQKFKYCTPIQEKSLAAVLAGKDLVGKANTGTGKTAVFLIAIMSHLLKNRKTRKGQVRALILAPTRELVVQITKDAKLLAQYTNLSVRAVYGGVDYQKQIDLLQNAHCDIVVATPGRLLDFMGKKIINLGRCSILVLDEADRMLDMGFIPDVRRIVGRLPNRRERQTMLFSATVPEDVERLALQWSVEPEIVEAEEDQVAVETVAQKVFLVTTEEKYTVLYNLIKGSPEDRFIIFANMKNETKRLADRLQRNGIDCVLLSGDVAQQKRMTRLENFRNGRVKVLVATDVAGRGIHIDGISFVVNFTLPYEPEDYVHRIGRTGRAGASGKAISFACEEGSFYLPAIEEFIGHKLECVLPDEELLEKPPKRQMHSEKSQSPPSKPRKKRRPRSRSKSSQAQSRGKEKSTGPEGNSSKR